jgi:hypothetical protein
MALLLSVPPLSGLAGEIKLKGLETGGDCPLLDGTHKARLASTAIKGRPGRPVNIRIILEPPQIPSGFFITSLVDVTKAPPGKRPEVLTGYPDISVTCFVPGDYLLEVRVNIIAKSSCGGARAATLLDKKVRLTISP